MSIDWNVSVTHLRQSDNQAIKQLNNQAIKQSSNQGFNTEATEKARRLRKGKVDALRVVFERTPARSAQILAFRVLRAFSVSSVLKPYFACGEPSVHAP
jgi:hypothetical protein